ncbi:hypothetical protein EW026_g6976 [Hermanssonia centrifuga]|uniref:L-serine ammonia-lyase n=1 Tax=Hermanssonia centrifuga TaxID=98765 RepID=A0A4S4KDP0_9APHY|nr:hypothetical protein EW026_g6976 [Hermanssonia centrifuga]
MSDQRTTNSNDDHLWLETPLIYSKHISAVLGANVYLKLDFLQPSYSFKYRGLSYFIQDALRIHGTDVHLVVASVYLPRGASASTLELFKQEGANVKEEGAYYQEALAAAEDTVRSEPNAVMVPAYDHPLLWEGHASMIEETARQLPEGTKPDAVVCCVGGGGLGAGVMVGCKNVGWDDVSFVAMETRGSNCFYQSLALNPGPFVSSPQPAHAGVEVLHDETYDVTYAKLPKLTSRASSLGASWPSPGAVKMALGREGGVKSVCVSDEMAMQTALSFANDHKILVELACATTLVSAYSPTLFDKLVPPKSSGAPRTVVFIVCGGFKISLEELTEYRNVLQSETSEHWDVLCNGEQWSIPKQ